MTGQRPIRVLVVDDSAFVRKVLRDVLGGAEGIEVVGTARDGVDALEQIAELEPDVLTLDLVMPQVDGIGVLAALERQPSAPRVVVVSINDEDSELGVDALARGAVTIIQKPTSLATDRLYEIRDELVRAVRLAAAARPLREPPRTAPAPAAGAAPAREPTAIELVVVGASTGGPQALTQLLAALPGDFAAPIAVVLHIPPGYTEPFARRLDAICALEVREAAEGMELTPGTVLIARAGLHMRVERDGAALRARLDVMPMGVPHRPSVDVLFESAAKTTAAHTLAVVLTGMGDDGLAGARSIRSAGGRVLVESEATSVVYGMPRVVREAGVAEAEAPIDQMAPAILARL